MYGGALGVVHAAPNWEQAHVHVTVYTRIGSNKGKTPEHNQAKHTKHPHSLEWHNSTICTCMSMHRTIPVEAFHQLALVCSDQLGDAIKSICLGPVVLGVLSHCCQRVCQLQPHTWSARRAGAYPALVLGTLFGPTVCSFPYGCKEVCKARSPQVVVTHNNN